MFYVSLKVLIAADFHASKELEQAAKKEIEEGEYDLFLYLGDFLDEEYAKSLLGEIDATCLATTGNHDTHFDLEMLQEEGFQIYEFLDATVDEKFTVVLVGGSYTAELSDQLQKVIENNDPQTMIIGSHYPPEKLGDLMWNGQRIGRPEFRKMIIKNKPSVWACGHVHEDYGEFSLMGTTVLNASSYDTGKAFSLELKADGSKEVNEVSLVDDLNMDPIRSEPPAE